MTTETTVYVVQYKSVYKEVGLDWRDADDKFFTIEEARVHAAALQGLNPQVRILSRHTTETVMD